MGKLLSLNATLQLAIGHHRAGRLAEAEAHYRAVLAGEPAHRDALHLWGLVCHQRGDHSQAIRLIEEAIRLNGQIAQYHNSLGECRRQRGELSAAETAYRRALALDPRYQEAMGNLGRLLMERGDWMPAEQHVRAALQLLPGEPWILAQLGAILVGQGKALEAVEACRQATQSDPSLTAAWIDLGSACHRLSRLREAEEALRRARELQPANAAILTSLGAVWHQQGKSREAAEVLAAALQIDPAHAAAYNNLGLLWRDLRRVDQARPLLERACQLRPDSVDFSNNLALVLQDAGMPGAAAARFRAILARAPTQALVWNNLGCSLREAGDIAAALESFDQASRLAGKEGPAARNRLFTLQFDPEISAARVFEEHRAWGIRECGRVSRERLVPGAVSVGRPVRLGYLSPDFRSHPVGYFMDAVLRHHSRERVEVVCFCDLHVEDDWTRRLRGHGHEWISIAGHSDEEAGRVIRQHRVDLLIDLAGHTARNRLPLLAARPAAWQASYLGYPGTTGLAAIDFKISDAWADPAGAECQYVEQLVRLPRCAWAYTPPVAVEAAPLPPNDRTGFVTFGCFNQLAKINRAVLAAWNRILGKIPNSRLVLKAGALEDPAVALRMRETFRGAGIADERITLAGRIEPMSAHFSLYNEIDVALDTFPYHGTTTTCDALWMGVPVVVLRGDRPASRVGASLLHAVGLESLIYDRVEDYIEGAVALAGDPDRLRTLRRELRGTMERSVLMDGAGLARALEMAIVEKLTPGR